VYFLSVHAQNAFGDGPALTVQVTPRAAGSGTGAGTAPGAPARLKTDYGDGFIALSWSPPASAGSSPVTGYHVYMGFSPSFTAAREFTVTGPSFRLNDAENGSTYFIKVTAVNAAGEGPATPRDVGHPRPARGAVPPAGLAARAGHGEVTLSWSAPPGGLKEGDGYLIYMGTSPGGEGAKPSYPHLIESATSFPMAPLTNGTRYYFKVALLDGNNQVSARSAEVSAVPVASSGSGSSSTTGNGTRTGSGGGGVITQPATPPPGQHAVQHDATSSPAASLIIVLAALSLAATGGAIAIVLIQRRRDGETGQRGRLMTPEDPTRAAVWPKSALDNWPMNAAAPPPREGRPWLESASE
jgi:fibronectin type III domain protein